MLHLIPFAPMHFAELASWFHSERDVVQWGGTGVSFPLDEGQLQAMIDAGHETPPARLCWMAAEGESFVGHAQLGFDWRNGNALLGRVAVSPDERGRGLAGPMLRLVIAEAFARPGIERVELAVFPWNTAAIRTYERIGFAHEGVRRSSARVREERWDTAFMAMLRADWQPN